MADRPARHFLTGGLRGIRARLAEATTSLTGPKERATADRGRRLAALIQGETWPDVRWIFEDAFDTYLQEVIAGEAHPDSLKALQDCYARFDAGLVLGQAAMARIASRHYQGVEAVERARTGADSPFNRPPTSLTPPAGPDPGLPTSGSHGV